MEYTEQRTSLAARCQQILIGNQVTSGTHRYTRPAPMTYEQQWLWDSCFHALVYRWLDPAMARDELLSVVAQQVKDGDDAGMIPHMAYWQGGGAALWGEDNRSIITQPPLIGVAAWRVYEITEDRDLLAALYPALVAYHDWFNCRRDPDNDHLVSLIHPWESGWDASPRWDAAMGLDAPTDEQSKAARHALVGVLREHNGDVRSLEAAGSFAVEAVDYNAIRAADLESLAHMADTLGKADEAARYREKAAAVQNAVRDKLCRDGRGVDLFGADETPGPEESAGQFVMLFGGCLTPDEAQTLVARLTDIPYWTRFPVPTSPTTAPRYDGGHYWRGNVWLAVNWLIYSGLRRYNMTAVARDLAARSVALVEQCGFHEYFHPENGTGYGPSLQSWSTIVLDMQLTEQQAMTDAFLPLLKQIYDVETADEVAAGLRERLPDAPPTQTTAERFSEADAVLITYGDSLLHEGEPPLQTLAKFAAAHLKPLFSHVHILPFYPYSSDDGFSVQDFYAVNPTMGDWPDVERLSDDFGLMFDAVFNHMSAQSEWFRSFLDGDADYAGMFATADPETDLSEVTRPRTSPLLTPFEQADGSTVHVWTTFSADQVDLNYADPQTLLKMVDVLLFYVERGASIIRLDAIAFLWKEPGTTCIHLPQTHAVIQLMRSVLDAVAPEAVLITETNVPHDENITYFGDGANEAQMVYNFTLPPMLFHTMLSGDCSKLNAWVRSLETPSPQTTFFNFTASHDGIGVRPVEGMLTDDELAAMIAHVEHVGGRVSYKMNANGSQSPYELNVSYVDAVTNPAEPLEQQARRFLVTQGIAMALAGVPAVYVHSLLGSRSDVAGMEAGGRNRLINRAKLNVETVEAALDDADSLRAQVFSGYAHLLKTRRAHRAFHPNSAQTVLDTGNPGVFALRRTPAEGDALTLLFNVTGQPQTVTLDGLGVCRDLLSGDSVSGPTATLTPYQTRWFVLES